MLVVGIALVLAGLLAIGFGILIELSTGNTLIVTGVMGVCTGAIMFALWIAVRELRNIARGLGGEAAIRPVLPSGEMGALASEEGVLPPGWDQPSAPQGSAAPSVPPPPWQDEDVLRDHPIPEPMFPEDSVPPPPPAAKPKRNLMFSSTSRKERERAQARTSEPLPPDMLSADLRPNPADAPPLAAEPAEPPPASFDDAWPKPDRGRASDIPSQRRSGGRPPPPPANGAPASNGDQPAVTVLKSGVVDGMAYSLYSDGSIEAQMPEGMMRFASIDELRAHLDHRP